MGKAKFEFEWLDWEERAYFSCPRVALDVPFPKKPRKKPWKAWCIAFSHACRGNFTYIPRIIEIADKELDGVLDQVCGYLFGDAGLSSCFPPLIQAMRLNENYEFTFHSADALATRGRLGDVEELLNAYEANLDNRDAGEFELAIGEMLDPGDYSVPRYESFCSFRQYRESINRIWKNLADRLGSENIYVWRGDIVSVEKIAKAILEKAEHDPFYFPSQFRRKFEASTGIDCSSFYGSKNIFQPLQAIKLVRGVLESSKVEQYRSGVRYFFGHPIPEDFVSILSENGVPY